MEQNNTPLVVSVPCYRCNRYHRIVPLANMLVIFRMGCYHGSKIIPSFFTIKEGSTFLTKPLFPQEREDVTALWCSEPLRYKDGGPSKVSPGCAGWDRLGNGRL